jgi:hypothetical protein
MKPCSRNKRRITWLVAGALDNQQVQHLQLHLESCPGCRQYFQEISGIFQRRAGSIRPPRLVQGGNSFRCGLDDRILASEDHSALTYWREKLREWRRPWSLTAAVICAASAILLAVSYTSPSHHELVSPQIASPKQNTSTPPLIDDSDPTICNYLLAVNKSFDAFNALLAEEGERRATATDRYSSPEAKMLKRGE